MYEMRYTLKIKRNNNNKIKTLKRRFNKQHYNSGDGMLTNVWGPSLWLFLHTISFNYPVKPTSQDKKYYKQLILNLRHTLPCKYCRENLKKNLKDLPLKNNHLKSRDEFSKYVYDLHEHINKMLGKTSNLTYNDVRDRFERFRSRCGKTKRKGSKKALLMRRKTLKRERGCVDPLKGRKAKCVIHIVPAEKKCKTFHLDRRLN